MTEETVISCATGCFEFSPKDVFIVGDELPKVPKQEYHVQCEKCCKDITNFEAFYLDDDEYYGPFCLRCFWLIEEFMQSKEGLDESRKITKENGWKEK